MKDLIPTVKITNFAGVRSIKDGMKRTLTQQLKEKKNQAG